VLARWDLPRAIEVAYGELWIEHVPHATVPQLRALPRFPATSRDLSLDVAVAVPAATIVAQVEEIAASVAGDGDDPPRLGVGDRGDAAIELVEDYRGEGIAPGRRALLVRMHYRCASRSVTDVEVQSLHELIVVRLIERLRGVDAGASRR
jgi:phenylalanyl-tRNA synthetase beta chain